MAAVTTPTSFASLPLEIRRMIYKYSFFGDSRLYQFPEREGRLRSFQHRDVQGLLLVEASTRLIAEEAREYLFTSLKFGLNLQDPLYTHYSVLNRRLDIKSYIRTVVVYSSIDNISEEKTLTQQLEILEPLRRLRKLTIGSVLIQKHSESSDLECYFRMNALCTPCTDSYVLVISIRGGKDELERVIERIASRVPQPAMVEGRPCGKCAFETASSKRYGKLSVNNWVG
ncbi:uncharacterized protein KY384_001308 [Bacidia gigantensis]|uniref:uncharacterized protein n=1 Tax=Bacidia gigantensis TaxID=2732470 RepID=UPI001D0593A5|nr:uncharacterized protein KY384_001308 [Bacidia gigantensis]KAG8533568.1 hypothetical protein KY384_001308 [Bacidia gigantensis]